MATTTRRERPVRTLVTLAVLVTALFAAILAGARWSDGSLVPKLALDLEGGTQIILRPVSDSGVEPTAQVIAQAIEIIRQRVDASGVAEAEITSQSGGRIVVSLPGEPDEATLELVRESAQMTFRPVIANGAPTVLETPTTSTVVEGTVPADASDTAWLTQDVLDAFAALDCTDSANLTGGAAALGDPAAPVIACQDDGSVKYVLGPVELLGDDIASASSGLRVGSQGTLTNEWVTNITMTSAGKGKFTEITTRLLSLESPRNQFAMVLDGLVISAPSVNSVIANGSAEISGSFTRESAATLARQLNFGALPLTFEVQSEQQISATLGSEQLQKGLLAGLVGLVLVGIYSLVQYRALGLVTIASLAVAGAIAYGLIALLSWTQGYRLSLPGVAGIIVAIGITADSFIVYFERVRDELRDGRTLPAAVAQGWVRARRTIIASDAVNFLAAFVLYFLAVGGVRGFAFTLGLTTLVDLVVVFMFTHPLLHLLARTPFFNEGHRFSGLDPEQLGARARYVGRGKISTPSLSTGTPGSPAADDIQDTVPVDDEPRRLTIAERRAAERAAQVDAGTDRKDA